MRFRGINAVDGRTDFIGAKLLAFHHRYLILRQLVELIDEAVDLPVGGVNLSLQRLLLSVIWDLVFGISRNGSGLIRRGK